MTASVPLMWNETSSRPDTLAEHADVVGDDRMHGAEDGPEILHPVPALLNPRLVAIESGDVEPVRAAHVEAPSAVEVAQARPIGRRDDRRQVELSRASSARRERAHGWRRRSAGRKTLHECRRPIRPIAVNRAPSTETADRALACGVRPRRCRRRRQSKNASPRVVMGAHPGRQPRGTRPAPRPSRGTSPPR